MHLKSIITLIISIFFLGGCIPTPSDNIAGMACSNYKNNECPKGYKCYQTEYKKEGQNSDSMCYRPCNTNNDCPYETPSCKTEEKNSFCYY